MNDNPQNCLLSKFVKFYCRNERSVVFVFRDVTGCRLQWILRGHATMLMNRPGRIGHVNAMVRPNAMNVHELSIKAHHIFHALQSSIGRASRPHDTDRKLRPIKRQNESKRALRPSLVSRGRIFAIICNKNSNANVDAVICCPVSLRCC